MLLALLACRADPVLPDPQDSPAPADSPADSEVPVDSDPPPPPVFVNELVADNGGTTRTPWGARTDWVELYNASDEAVDLSGWAITDDYTDKAKVVLPEGMVLEAGEHRVLWADGVGEQEDAIALNLAAEGESVHLFDTEGERVDHVVYPGLLEDTAYARLPDGSEDWGTTLIGTPGEANREISVTEVQPVAAGDTWAFWDQGSHPGEGWSTAGFDASGWGEGPAPLGYGDSDIVTTVSYGEDSSDKHPTTWFRKEVELPAGSLVEGLVQVQCDDGCVVWIEGEELGRRYMPDGDIDETTYADETAYGDSETAWNRFELDPQELEGGTVAIGVEVHQVGGTSSDIRMDLQLDLTLLQ